MIVGKADLETWEITHREGGKFHMPGANSAGLSGTAGVSALVRAAAAVLDLVDNVPHDGLKCVPRVQDFLAATLRRLRNE